MSDRNDSADAEMIEAMFAGYDPAELAAASEAQRDIHGTFRDDEPGNDGPSDEETAAQDVKDAISRLPPTRREAYDRAAAHNPKIVDLESPPRRFLLATDNDYWAAACRIADYWNKRREVFGPERYYKPMRISSETEDDSCLNKVTQDAMKSGAYMALPPENFGRPVFFLDMERFTEACKEPHTRVMVTFYLLQILSESDLAVRNGFVGIFATESASEVAKSQQFRPSPECVRLALSEAVPTKGRAGHLLALRKPTFFTQSMNLWMSCFQHWNRVEARSVLHYADSKEESLIDLLQYGFSPHHLPERFGGTVDFDKWYQDRVKLEEERYASLRAAAAAPGSAGPIVGTQDEPDSSLADTFSDQDERKPAALEPAELARLKRQKLLKRKMEEVHDYNRCEMEKRKVARLKSDGESLRKDHHLLKAQLVCSDHVTDLYEKDKSIIKQRIVECISKFIPSVPGVALDMVTHDEKHQLLAESLMTYFLEFQGRHPVNGRWLFKTSESNLSNGVLSDVEWLRQDLLQYQETLDGSLRPRSGVELDDSATPGKKSPTAESDRSTTSCGSDDDVSKLQAQVDSLTAQNTSLKRNRPFLESLLVCATYAAEQHLKDRKEIEEEMVELFNNSPQLLPSAKLLVNNILNDFTIFEGRNPRTGQKLYHFMGGLLQTLHMFSSEGQEFLRQQELQQQRAQHAERQQEADERWREARAKRKRDLKRL